MFLFYPNPQLSIISLLGKITLENEMLKKIRDLDTMKKKDNSSIVTSRDWDRLKGGAR